MKLVFESIGPEIVLKMWTYAVLEKDKQTDKLTAPNLIVNGLVCGFFHSCFSPLTIHSHTNNWMNIAAWQLAAFKNPYPDLRDNIKKLTKLLTPQGKERETVHRKPSNQLRGFYFKFRRRQGCLFWGEALWSRKGEGCSSILFPNRRRKSSYFAIQYLFVEQQNKLCINLKRSNPIVLQHRWCSK